MISHVTLDIWSRMKSHSLTDEVDAVVIGTGAGGAPLLARLASAGLKVVALEAGPRFEPFRDFATDERSQGQIFWRHERLSAGEDALAFGNNNSGTGVGGSTLHYTAYTPRPHEDDFSLKRDFGKGEDWPISFDELEPYFGEVENFIGVSGPSEYPWSTSKHQYPFAALPLNKAAQLMKKGCDAQGIRTSPAANAALSAPFFQEGVGLRPACRNRGYCQAGCNTGAKSSMDVTFIPFAVHHGAEVRDQSYVSGFERTGDRITAVIYRRGVDEFRQRTKAVFLCAGGVETPRLLLLHDLALSSGHVGRNFMAHPGTQVWGFFDHENFEPWAGIPGALISEDFHRAPQGEYAAGYLLQSIGVMPVTYASQMVRGLGLYGQALKDHMSRYSHVAGINILGDCFPSENNFVELSSEVDDTGFAKPRVHFTFGENEKAMMAHSEKIMRAIWSEAGANDLWTFQRGAHVIGTARMGTRAEESVVDPNGKAHDMENLYVCDNSVFPSALSVNPSLTIMALSLRTADRFLGVQRELSRRYS